MHINTKAIDFDLTPAISDFISKKLQGIEKLVSSDKDGIMIDVEVGKPSQHHKSGDVFRTEINFYIDGKCLRAVSNAGDLYSSIDEAKDQLVQEIHKFKNKKRSLIRRGGQKIKRIVKGFYKGKNEKDF